MDTQVWNPTQTEPTIGTKGLEAACTSFQRQPMEGPSERAPRSANMQRCATGSTADGAMLRVKSAIQLVPPTGNWSPKSPPYNQSALAIGLCWLC